MLSQSFIATNSSSFSILWLEFIVFISNFSLFPITFNLLLNHYSQTWSKAAFAYGILLGSHHFGHCFGLYICGYFERSITSCSTNMNSYWFRIHLLLLIMSYVATCVISRVSVMVIVFSIIGYCGSAISCMVLYSDKVLRWDSQSNSSEVHQMSEAFAQRLIFFYILSTFFSIICYDQSIYAGFPRKYHAILFISFVLLLIIYKYLLSITKSKKIPKINTSLVPNSNAAGGNVSYVVGAHSQQNTDYSIDFKGPIPSNFLSVCKGNLEKARQLYSKSLLWRKEKRMDNIFETPLDHFQTILTYYPHAIHGYSLEGHAVVYEILGKGNPYALKEAGVSMEQLVWHFVLRNELIFKRLLDPNYIEQYYRQMYHGMLPDHYLVLKEKRRPNLQHDPKDVTNEDVGKMMAVLDVGGISINSVTTDVLSFMKQSGEIIDNFYPERVGRLVVCNAPRWFYSIWAIIARVLPDSVKQKIDILNDIKGLDKYIHPSQRPAVYGGTDVNLGAAPGHVEFLKIAEGWKNQSPTHGTTVHRSEKGSNRKDLESNGRSVSMQPMDSGGEGRNKKSMFEWINFRKQPGPNVDKTAAVSASKAYLGEKNQFKFNESTGRWEIDVSDDLQDMQLHRYSQHEEMDDRGRGGEGVEEGTDRSSNELNPMKKKPKLSAEQLEEHGLVLAIQAAHLASSYNKDRSRPLLLPPHHPVHTHGLDHNSLRSMSSDPDGFPGNGPQHRNQSPANSTERKKSGPRSFSNHHHHHYQYQQKHTLNENDKGLQSLHHYSNDAIETTGLASSSSDFEGKKISTDIFLLVTTIYFVSSFIFCMLSTLCPMWLMSPKHSGGLGLSIEDVGVVLITTATFLSIYHKYFLRRFNYILRGSPVRTIRIGSQILFVIAFIFIPSCLPPPSDRHPIVQDQHLHHHLPVDSPLSLMLPALLIAMMVASTFTIRKAASALIQLSLETSFASPNTLRVAINTFIGIVGPVASCLIFTSGHKKHTMDSSLFISLIGCLVFVPYIGSLFLRVQFRGDYGVIVDHDLDGTSLDPSRESREWSESWGNTGSTSLKRRAILRPEDTSPSGGCCDLVSLFGVPIGDAELLFANIRSGNSYGSKLYNLKDDFKDL